MKNSQELAVFIKEIAKEKNISIGKMLSDCNLSINTLSSMKSGGFFPRVEALAKIADYLGCSIDYLLGRTDVSTFETQTSDANITPREKAVLLAYREKKDLQAAVERLLDVKIEVHPEEPIPSAKEPRESEYDSFMKRVDTLTDHGRIKLKDAKIAAYGGYENPVAAGEDLEKLKQIRRLLQEVIDEQHNQPGE